MLCRGICWELESWGNNLPFVPIVGFDRRTRCQPILMQSDITTLHSSVRLVQSSTLDLILRWTSTWLSVEPSHPSLLARKQLLELNQGMLRNRVEWPQGLKGPLKSLPSNAKVVDSSHWESHWLCEVTQVIVQTASFWSWSRTTVVSQRRQLGSIGDPQEAEPHSHLL